MTEALRRLWGSISLRLAFYFALLVAITMLASLATIYIRTVGVLQQSMVRQVTATAQTLGAYLARGDLDNLVIGITRSVGDGVDSDSEIYLLLDPAGQKLAGNIDSMFNDLDETDRVVKSRVFRAGQLVSAYVLVQKSADGTTLVVGTDLRDLDQIQSLVAQASASAIIIALVLLIGGTFAFRLAIEGSIGAVRRTTARIVAGNLKERVVLSGQDDEFTLLNRDINGMLDRIEALMNGVRHVSDTIAHNLRTPLTRIVLQLRAAEDEAICPEERRKAIASAAREIEELTKTFEKLLLLAEAEAGARRRHFTPVALHSIVDDVIELYDEEAASHSASVRHEPAMKAQILGDRDLLAGVIVNLVDNAIKYAGDSAVILIGTWVSDNTALLTVRDNGPGVPASELGRLGNRFHRLNRNVAGHGLGLASVRAVVQLHGGEVRFSDAQPGLHVEIRLPRMKG